MRHPQHWYFPQFRCNMRKISAKRYRRAKLAHHRPRVLNPVGAVVSTELSTGYHHNSILELSVRWCVCVCVQGRIQDDANASVRKNCRCIHRSDFTANNKKQHFLRKHKAYNALISTKLYFPRNDYNTYSKFTSKRFVFLKTRPRTIMLTFPSLIHTAMFQNLLFNNVNIKSFIFDFVYVFESAYIKCVYAITHMSVYPL